MFLVGMVAVGLLLFPAAANWVSDLQHTQAITSYTRHLAEQHTTEQISATLAAADSYNTTVPDGRIRDPYTSASTAPSMDQTAYLAQLNFGSDVRARLSYPRLGIDLPVYLGTDAQILRKGVGHLFGSSLPVGGTGTHSVLTAHSGAPYAALFDPIHQARADDRITVEVGDRTLIYRVTGTATVRPDDTSALRVEPGADRLTLLTCTPIGVASHRLLVHAERVSDDEAQANAPQDDRTTRSANHLIGAWWIPVAAVLATGLWRLSPPVRRGHRASHGRSTDHS